MCGVFVVWCVCEMFVLTVCVVFVCVCVKFVYVGCVSVCGVSMFVGVCEGCVCVCGVCVWYVCVCIVGLFGVCGVMFVFACLGFLFV